MSISYNPKIIDQDIQLLVDYNNPRSNKDSFWINLVNQERSNLHKPWTVDLQEFTCISFIDVIGFNTNYAIHPINKWSGTTNATFVLYHFQNFNNNNDQNKFGWYGNRGGVWGGISAITYLAPGQTYMIGLQYHYLKGGRLWINGNPFGNRSPSGILANTTNTLNIDIPQGSFPDIHRVKYCAMYNRELSDNEIRYNFNAIKRRYIS